ncbi:MAG: PAS domain-containing protein [Synergistaceae bacterium]|jgi:PAS domain-containing protein|nr:PAS domain-containing protein [Synergistaceae bacterium]
MAACLDLLPIINTLPHAVLVLSRDRGKIIGANDIFLRQTGFDQEGLLSVRLIDLPLFSRQAKRSLIRLYVKAQRGQSDGEAIRLEYVAPDQTLKNVAVTASRFEAGDQSYVTFVFREAAGMDPVDLESWKYCMDLTCEPYMEFQPSMPLIPPLELDDRMSFLKLAGSVLRVKYANRAAVELYDGENGSMTGASFSSIFNREEDALRFLDMLSVVGQMKAETALSGRGAQIVQVEMHCVVRFDDDGGIAALYCSQRDLSGARRYEAIIGGSRVETDFMFHQPFTGVAFFTPTRPLERPRAEDVDMSLDNMLEQIVVMRANRVMIDIHGSDRARFMLKPIRELFPDSFLARQVLKELFVMRSSSVAIYNADDTLAHVSVFRATFDDADRMNGILMVSSKHKDDYQVRYSNKKGESAEDKSAEDKSAEDKSAESKGEKNGSSKLKEDSREDSKEDPREPELSGQLAEKNSEN